METEAKEIWGQYGKTEYNEVTTASAKKELDLSIVELITQEHAYNNPSTPSLIAEFGCGPAPISEVLIKFNKAWGKDMYRLAGFDNSFEMSRNLPEDKNFSFFNTNISDPFLVERYLGEGGELLDTVILENSWYAVTTGIGHLDKEEALYRRWTVLLNAWRLLKENGTLIITDPLSSTQNVGLMNTMKGLMKEVSSASKRGEISESIKNIKNPETKNAIKRNKEEILPTSQLFGEQEMLDFIKQTGLFEVEYLKRGDYLGHNLTLQLRKINEVEPKVNGTFALDILASSARELLERFRERNYSEKINPIVTGVDEQDKKHKKSLTVLASIIGMNVPGAIATFDIEEDYNLDSWEFGDLFVLPKDFDKLIPQNRKTGEIRRLGTISAYGEEYNRIGLESIKRVIERIYKEVYDQNLGILFFTATPDRVMLFNRILKNLGVKEFEKVEGVELNREDPDNIRTILTGAKYFFTEDGFDNVKRDEILNRIREYMIENKDVSLDIAVSELWPNEKDLKMNYIHENIKDTGKFPMNVSLYYVQVPQEKMEVRR